MMFFLLADAISVDVTGRDSICERLKTEEVEVVGSELEVVSDNSERPSALA